ncbi:MAG: transketolase C-terminal domain-containing protein [Thiolinea sp.]
MLQQLADSHDYLVTLEDNAVQGGAGSAVNECLQALQCQVPVLNLGIPDRYVEHAQREEQLASVVWMQSR